MVYPSLNFIHRLFEAIGRDTHFAGTNLNNFLSLVMYEMTKSIVLLITDTTKKTIYNTIKT